jgi:hypothetical protein
MYVGQPLFHVLLILVHRPFAFLLGLGAFSFVLLLLVDVEKSRLECAEYLAAEARLEGLEEA